MVDEKQDSCDFISEKPIADIYVSSTIEKQFLSYQGILPQYERNTLAKNLGEIIACARSDNKKLKNGAIVIEAGVRPGTSDAGAVNALNSYCLLPEGKSRRKARPKLHAHPINYLKLARAAGHLAGWPKHKAVMMLSEGSNAFSGSPEIDIDKFTPAEAVIRLLRDRLSIITSGHQLNSFFHSVQELSAEYGYDISTSTLGWKQVLFGDLSTSHWPSVCLTTLVRSSGPAHLVFDGVEEEEDGEVIGAEEVYLTLGWDLNDRVVAYLEFLPCLVVNTWNWHENAPWVDFGTIAEVPRDGGFRDGRFRLKDGVTIDMPSGNDGNTWPYRLRTHARFERITPALLADTFINSKNLRTSWHKLNRKIDTSEVMSPASSPLAWMEAELLGRGSLTLGKTEAGFLVELETKVKQLVSSFGEWREEAARRAEMDHQDARLKMRAELDASHDASTNREQD